MEENYITKEVDDVISRLKEYFSTDGMKNSFSRENNTAKDKFEVDTDHEYLDEISRFYHDGHELNIPSLRDLDPLFLSLDKGAILGIPELFEILDLLTASSDLYDKLYDKKEYFHLNDDALDLNPLSSLKRDLETDLEDDMTVSDRASAKLRDLRVQERDLKHSLTSIMNTYKSKYSMYLSSDSIAYKDGEETLPIKVCYKNAIKGAILSYSSSGETAFLVPYEVLSLKNRLTSIETEEGEEILKVLSELSQKAAKQLMILKKDNATVLRFDRYNGAVKYGNSYLGCIAERSDDVLTLKGVFHPLLKGNKIITNSLSLGKEDPKALLISGPNAGGKSILIKAVALSVLMDKLGLLVPCKVEAKIPFLDEVFFQGGDNQSVLDNLSTFSSSLLGIKNITQKATKDSLVIIDEVGEGTSPKDGEALGVGLLKFFEKVGCLTILTSHFDGLKIYAAGDSKCLTGAMEFNTQGLIPTYHLLLRTTGKSYGILLAKNMGLAKEIIDDAESFEHSRENQDADMLLEKVTEQVSENEKIKRDLEIRKKELEKAIQAREIAIKALNEERGNIHAKAEEKIARIIDKKVEEIDRAWQSKSTKASYSEVSKAKGELNKMKEVNEPTKVGKGEQTPDDLKAGEYVEDEDGRQAEVLEVKKNRVSLDMDGLRFERPLKGLLRVHKKEDKKEAATAPIDSIVLTIGNSGGIELNIIGEHVDDAMREVVQFLDRARVKKLSYVRIIHGMGSFALKNAVWKYLSNHKEFVKDYELGGQGDGGMGATIVHLK